MSAPRLEIDIEKIRHNAKTLVERLAARGISVTGVTKATLGSPEIARALVRSGVAGLADSRIENLEGMRLAGVLATMTLIRAPMLSQAKRVVAYADVSFNTEIATIRELSDQAGAIGKRHRIVLMVELGDLREGILPADLQGVVEKTLGLPNVVLEGLGANLACRSGVTPSAENMALLSSLANGTEETFGIQLNRVSGGTSANLQWALGPHSTGRIDDLRLGEAILLGREPLARQPIEGLHTDAFTLYAEVIEAKSKPSLPWGNLAQSAFGTPVLPLDRGTILQGIFAIGRQDTDPAGLTPSAGIELLGSSSDHLIADLGATRLPVGAEAGFQLNYSALLRTMNSTFVTKTLLYGVGVA